MASFRSSVRPTNSKQPWGTILKPEFGLGYQKMTGYEIDQTVNRLCVSPTPKCRTYSRVGKKMSSEEIDEMLQRLTNSKKEKIPDSDRRVTSSPVHMMGVVSSYAWNGYNRYF